MSEAEAVRRTHDFFKTVDSYDTAGFRVLLGSKFSLFEDGRSVDAAGLSRGWAKMRDKGIKPRLRTCTKEQVRQTESVVVYVGDCIEHVSAMGKRPATKWQGWNTVVWTRVDRAWKVAWWQWNKSGIAADRDRWNEVYRKADAYTKKPNQLLVTKVAGVKPGDALVVAMGQGRNALYLASLGWRVTGVDISDEGIRKAKHAAAARNLSLTTVLADLNSYDFGTRRWDLVTMLYAGNNVNWINKIKPSIKPGGMFILEYFHSTKGTGFNSGQLAKLFVGWQIIVDSVTEGLADWGQHKTKLVRFIATKPVSPN